MRIHNCLIIVGSDAVLSLEPGELMDFSGNVVYRWEDLPAPLVAALQDHTGFIENPKDDLVDRHVSSRQEPDQFELAVTRRLGRASNRLF